MNLMQSLLLKTYLMLHLRSFKLFQACQPRKWRKAGEEIDVRMLNLETWSHVTSMPLAQTTSLIAVLQLCQSIIKGMEAPQN